MLYRIGDDLAPGYDWVEDYAEQGVELLEDFLWSHLRFQLWLDGDV